jgi:hypothetical protein
MPPAPSTLEEQLQFFFAEPDPTVTAGLRSPLALIRQEAQDCFLGTVVVPEPTEWDFSDPHRLFATAMILCSGIDLLAKFYTGQDDQDQERSGEARKGVSKRFREFAERFIVNDSDDPETAAKVLYEGARNPITHSFTLHNRQDHKVMFGLGFDRHEVVALPIAPEVLCAISLEQLFRAFFRAIREYQAAVRGSEKFQDNFSKMFTKYGTVQMAARMGSSPKPFLLPGRF